jgi:hypothetical protein
VGSWSETCGLTGLPIQYDDDVMLTFLTQTTSHGDDSSGTCYPTGWWTPYALPIPAKYADYGEVELLEETWNTKWVLEHVRKDMLELEQGENPYHEYAVTVPELDGMEQLMRWISNDRLFVRRILPMHDSRGLRLGWMMCHKWAYEWLAQKGADHVDRDVYFEQVLKQGLEWYRQGLRIAQNWEGQDPNSRRLFELWEWLEGGKAQGEWGRVFGAGSGMDGYGAPTRIGSYRTLVEQWVTNLLPVHSPEVMDFLHSMSQYLIVSRNLQRLRKHWSPQSGKGSQGCDFTYYQAWLAQCQSHVAAKIAEWEGDDDEFTDDETVDNEA